MSAGQQGQNQTDQTANFFWILCMMVGAVLLVWYFDKQWLVVPTFWVRVHEITLVKYAADILVGFDKLFHLPVPHVVALDHLQHFMTVVDPRTVHFAQFSAINDYMGKWMRYPAAFILMIMAGIVYFRHGSTRFRQTYSMQSLRKTENECWPQITPVVSLDLVAEDIDKGPWAMAQAPLDFAKEHGMAKLVKDDKGNNLWSVDKGPAYRAFTMQLGPLWRGEKSQPIHIKALIVIFLACAHRDRPTADRFLTQIARSAASGKLDFTGVSEQLKKFKNDKVIRWLELRHAYTRTLVATMIEVARKDGVLATAEFLWLKPIDRYLWYMLNSVGRAAAVVEAAGPFSHWLAEKRMQRPLKVPMIHQAVSALEEDVRQNLYIEEGTTWHTVDGA